MNIRILLVNPFLYTLCLVSCWGLSLYGQQQSDPALHFIDSLNHIITSQPVGSKAQTAASEDLRARLLDKVKYGSAAQKHIAVRLIQELDYKVGAYKALLPPKPPDTLGHEVLRLEEQLKKLQDSIIRVQQALVKIIENKHQTDSTKERAVFILAKIHNKEALDYLFENEGEMYFSGPLHPEDNESWEQQLNRTAMVAISSEYFYKENTEVEKWLLLNYLLYDIKQDGFQEFVLINNLLALPERYKSPELLLEFMYKNASPDSQKTIDKALKIFLPPKNNQKD